MSVAVIAINGKAIDFKAAREQAKLLVKQNKEDQVQGWDWWDDLWGVTWS